MHVQKYGCIINPAKDMQKICKISIAIRYTSLYHPLSPPSSRTSKVHAVVIRPVYCRNTGQCRLTQPPPNSSNAPLRLRCTEWQSDSVWISTWSISETKDIASQSSCTSKICEYLVIMYGSVWSVNIFGYHIYIYIMYVYIYIRIPNEISLHRLLCTPVKHLATWQIRTWWNPNSFWNPSPIHPWSWYIIGIFNIPSGYLLHSHGKSPFLIGKPSIDGPSIPWRTVK